MTQDFEFYQDAFKRGDLEAVVQRLMEAQRRRAAERVARNTEKLRRRECQ